MKELTKENNNTTRFHQKQNKTNSSKKIISVKQKLYAFGPCEQIRSKCSIEKSLTSYYYHYFKLVLKITHRPKPKRAEGENRKERQV